MRLTGRVLLMLLCLAAVLPAAASAHAPATIAPPGDSAITQYVEDIPTDQGPTPTQSAHGGPRAPLPAGITARSGDSRATGRDLAAIVAATAPGSGGARSGGRDGHTRDGAAGGVSTPGGAKDVSSASAIALSPAAVRSPESLLAGAAVGGGGLGLLVGVLLLASLAGAAAVRVRRGRQSP